MISSRSAKRTNFEFRMARGEGVAMMMLFAIR